MRATTHSALPDDAAALRALVSELQTRLQIRDDALAAREAQLQAGAQELVHLRTWVDKLKLEIAPGCGGCSSAAPRRNSPRESHSSN